MRSHSSGNRTRRVPATVDRLGAAGHEVECWGEGWPAGRLDHEGMVRVFGTSRINLNLSNSSLPPNTIRVRIGRLLRRGPKHRPAQIKGRNFEVPGCGGFLLTERVPYLERTTSPGGRSGCSRARTISSRRSASGSTTTPDAPR